MADKNLLTEGEIVYQNVRDVIDMFPTPGARHLEEMLDREIRKYKRSNVLQAMAQAPEDSIAFAQFISQYEDDAKEISKALKEFADMITGLIPDAEKAKAIGDLTDIL